MSKINGTRSVLIRNILSAVIFIIGLREIVGNFWGGLILILCSFLLSSISDKLITKFFKGIYSPLKRVLVVVPTILLVAALSARKGSQTSVTKRLDKNDSTFVSKNAEKTISRDHEKKVVNSYLDGSVWQVKEYLKKNLNDADSYDPIEWSEVQQFDYVINHKYLVRHKYRAKNEFGGTILFNQVFYLDSNGVVVKIKDWQ